MAGFDIGLSRLEVSALVKRLALAEPVMRKELPKRLREAVKPIAEQARVNASDVSPHIKIGTRVKLNSRRGASVKILGTSPGNEPIAGLKERGNRGDTSTTQFYTKLRGRVVWQDMEQYIQPAMDAGQDEAIARTSEVITDVLIAMKLH